MKRFTSLTFLAIAISGSGCDIIAKPAVPVVVTYRESLVGNGKVAIFSNQTSNRLTITVTYRNKQLNQTKTEALDLDPNGKMEIGWLEGWRFLPGETITVSHPNYRSNTVTIPGPAESTSKGS